MICPENPLSFPRQTKSLLPDPLPPKAPRTNIDKYAQILKTTESFLDPSMIARTKKSNPSISDSIPPKMNQQLNEIKSTRNTINKKPFLTNMSFAKTAFVTDQPLTDRTSSRFPAQDFGNKSRNKEDLEASGLNPEIWKKAQFTNDLIKKDINSKIKRLKIPNEVSYLHSDIKDSVADSLNKTSIVFRDFQSPQPSKSPNLYCKMSEFGQKTPDYLTSLTEIKEKIHTFSVANEAEITKILDPQLFRQTTFKINNRHLNKHYNPAFSYTLEYHTSQNKNLAKPSIRKDVENLERWLQEMLELIKRKEDYCFQSLIEDLQIIYSACLKELIRQVGLHCSERGQLLEKVWNCYLDLLEKAVASNNRERELLEKAHLNEIKRIYGIFDKEVENYKTEICNLKKKEEENGERLKKYIEEVFYLRTKHHRLEKENYFLRNHSEELLKDLKNLAKDLYNYQINDAAFETERGKSIPFKLAEISKRSQIPIPRQVETFVASQPEPEIEERAIREIGVNTSFESAPDSEEMEEVAELEPKPAEIDEKNENIDLISEMSQGNLESMEMNGSGSNPAVSLEKASGLLNHGTASAPNLEFETHDLKKKHRSKPHKKLKDAHLTSQSTRNLKIPSISVGKKARGSKFQSSFDPKKAEKNKNQPNPKKRVSLTKLTTQKLDREIQVDLVDFLPSPSLKDHAGSEERHFSYDNIVGDNENALEALKTFEKATKSLSSGKEDAKALQNFRELIEIGKENLMENMELKKEITKLSEELTHFLRENKKLRFTYQKAISENDEGKEKLMILSENLQILEGKYSELLRSLRKREDENRRLSISKINKFGKFIDKFKVRGDKKNSEFNISEISEDSRKSSLSLEENQPVKQIQLFSGPKPNQPNENIRIEINPEDNEQTSPELRLSEPHLSRSLKKERIFDFFTQFIEETGFQPEKTLKDLDLESQNSESDTEEKKGESGYTPIPSQKDLMLASTASKSRNPEKQKPRIHDSNYWLVPNLGLRKRQGKSVVSYSINADALLREVIAKRDSITFTYLTKTLVFKFMSNVLVDCINRRRESKFNSQTPLHVILYENFLNRYGLRRTVEKKLKQVDINCLNRPLKRFPAFP